jgi:serine protease inhibitor
MLGKAMRRSGGAAERSERGGSRAFCAAIGVGLIAAACAGTADKPFLYFLSEQESGTILFMGRVNDPSAR